MRRIAISFILLSSLLFASGCTEKTQETPANHQNIQNNSTERQNVQNISTNHQDIQSKSIVVEATKLKQINMLLQKGPVLLEIGAPKCSDCQAIKPILAQIAADYAGKVTVTSLNMSKNPKLADYFGAYVVPVSFVILDVKNGNYTYMREDGNISTNKSQAKIVGLRHKKVFEKVLDTALQQKKINPN